MIFTKEQKALAGYNLFIALAMSILVSCTSSSLNGNDPKKRIQEYITKSFSISKVEQRKELESLLSGEAKSRLISWSDDQFSLAFIDSKRKFQKLSFKELKALSDTETQVTYELTYSDDSKGTETQITQKKLASLVKTRDEWFIKEVKNVKEVIEYKNELSLP